MAWLNWMFLKMNKNGVKPEGMSGMQGSIPKDGDLPSMIALPPEASTLDLSAALHDLNADERRTCESIIKGTAGSCITPMPTHHIDQHGRMCGFTFTCPGNSPISALPLSRCVIYISHSNPSQEQY